METTSLSVNVSLVSLGKNVKQTLMNVNQIHAWIMQPAQMVSTPTPVIVQLDIMEATVKQT